MPNDVLLFSGFALVLPPVASSFINGLNSSFWLLAGKVLLLQSVVICWQIVGNTWKLLRCTIIGVDLKGCVRGSKKPTF